MLYVNYISIKKEKKQTKICKEIDNINSTFSNHQLMDSYRLTTKL